MLAAGASSRLGQAKQLLPFNSTSLIRNRITSIRKVFSNDHELLVVTGAGRAQIVKEMEGLEATEIFNPHFSEGMSTSIKAGLEMLPTVDAALMMLVDQPFVTEKHLTEMSDKWLKQPDKILAAAYSGITGVPAIFPSIYFENLRSLRGDQGARKILQQLPESEVITYRLPEASIDIDTLEDLKAIGL